MESCNYNKIPNLSAMKILVFLLALFTFTACTDDKLPTDVVILESDAQWVNMLATDGCSWHFEVPSGDSLLYYLPSETSLKVVEKELGKKEDYYSFTKVHIRYSLTDRKKGVACGWGATGNFTEIEVYKIDKE